jgi:predicted DNA-binding transcriptional regulator AlpA
MQPEATVKKQIKSLPIEDRYGVTVPVAATFIGISRSRIYELLTAGELDGKIIHGRRIVLVKSMLRMCGEAPTTKREAA